MASLVPGFAEMSGDFPMYSDGQPEIDPVAKTNRLSWLISAGTW
jgi:hypothetical protein